MLSLSSNPHSISDCTFRALFPDFHPLSILLTSLANSSTPRSFTSKTHTRSRQSELHQQSTPLLRLIPTDPVLLLSRLFNDQVRNALIAHGLSTVFGKVKMCYKLAVLVLYLSLSKTADFDQARSRDLIFSNLATWRAIA